MKRYNCESNDNCGYMQEDPNGEYVKYEELKELRKEKQLWWQYLTKVVRDTSGWLKYKGCHNG